MKEYWDVTVYEINVTQQIVSIYNNQVVGHSVISNQAINQFTTLNTAISCLFYSVDNCSYEMISLVVK